MIPKKRNPFTQPHKRRPSRRLEEIIQKQVVGWASYASNKYPELEMLYHSPMESKRDPKQGATLKAMGMKKGFPDLILPVARDGFFSLAIELKVEDKEPTDEQDWWLLQLDNQGWKTLVCRAFYETRDVIEQYLNCIPTIRYMTDRRIKRSADHEPERRVSIVGAPYSNKSIKRRRLSV